MRQERQQKKIQEMTRLVLAEIYSGITQGHFKEYVSFFNSSDLCNTAVLNKMYLSYMHQNALTIYFKFPECSLFDSSYFEEIFSSGRRNTLAL